MSEESREVESKELENHEEVELIEADPEEVQARKNNWVDIEEWTAQGKDPKDHVPAKFYNEKGKMISTIKSLQNQVKGVDERLAKNNEYWKVALESQEQALKSQRKEAIELADSDAVDKIDSQLDDIKAQKADLNAPSALEKEHIQHEVQWMEENKWLSGRSAKAIFAQAIANENIQKGIRGKELTSLIESEVAKEFKPTNPNREKATIATGGKKSSPSGKVKLSMSSLSPQEKQIAQSLMNRGYTEKQVLKMAEDSRV